MPDTIAPSARQRVLNAAPAGGLPVPFGLGATKPKHFREMFRAAWANRDNLGYAWKVLSQGVCDGCALGVAGLHDWTLDGVHLCLTRLSLLRLNTMPAFDPGILADVGALRGRSNAELCALGRLGFPMHRARGEKGFRRISWEDAQQRIADRWRRSDPERLAFFVTSRGVTNEVYYVAQKAARFLGTNHVDNAARLCHAPSTGAMKHALGYAASTCSYRDWYGTDLIVFFGSNPANDQPVTMKYLDEARARGTRVAMVNPFLEPGMIRYWVPSTPRSAVFGTPIADWWFPVAQGGDIAFLQGVLRVLIERDWYDRAFVETHTADWDAFRASVLGQDPSALEAASGLSRADFEEFAALLHASRNAVFVWSMGITQHARGGDAVSMILNLGLAMGYVGRPRTGLMPIRGHSSVQGGAEMGCYSTAFPGGKPVTSENAGALAAQYGFPVPDWTGMTAVEMVEACARDALDTLYCVGGNFLRTLPAPDQVARAMQRVPLRVHQDIIVTDQMLLEPGEEVILLPAKTRFEQDDGGIETSTERRVMFSPEIPRQVGEARAEWRILRDLAAATHPERAHLLGCQSGQAIREEIARVIPFYDGVQHLRKTGDAIQWGGERLCEEGRFGTADGKGHFKVVALPADSGVLGAIRSSGQTGARHFHVSTRRGKQFNTLIHAERDPLTGADRDAVFMHPADAAELNVANGDRVVLVSEVGRLEARVFPASIARGSLQVHWPEGNVLIPHGVVDSVGGVPDYNAIVRIERP
ncbi:MAG: FdhF/YdeP family oxidoreductase [Verrucomicrobiae bacterium]|nr:FdhF/YdeP family oxidoreductase [Verrucomicrobiae bacterium]